MGFPLEESLAGVNLALRPSVIIQDHVLVLVPPKSPTTTNSTEYSNYNESKRLLPLSVATNKLATRSQRQREKFCQIVGIDLLIWLSLEDLQ